MGNINRAKEISKQIRYSHVRRGRSAVKVNLIGNTMHTTIGVYKFPEVRYIVAHRVLDTLNINAMLARQGKLTFRAETRKKLDNRNSRKSA